MGIPQPLWATYHWSHSWWVNLKKNTRKKSSLYVIAISCAWVSLASHHSAVHFGKESDSIYSISSVVMGFPLVTKAIFSIWTKAELVVKPRAVFPWRPFWSYTSQIPSLMFWRWGLECGWISIPVTADLLLSINIQQFHSIIFLKRFPLLQDCAFCVLKLIIWQVRFRHLPRIVCKAAG